MLAQERLVAEVDYLVYYLIFVCTNTYKSIIDYWTDTYSYAMSESAFCCQIWKSIVDETSESFEVFVKDASWRINRNLDIL